MLSYRQVAVEAIVPPADAEASAPSEMVPLGEPWDRHDCLLLDERVDQPPPNLHIIAGHRHYWVSHRAGHQRVEALVRQLDPDLEIRLQEHYAIGGLTPAEELELLDKLAHERGITRAEVARSLGANPSQEPL